MSLKPTAEAVPVIAVVGLGCVLSGFICWRNLTQHNLVVIDKKKPYQFRTQGLTKFNGAGSDKLHWDADAQKWVEKTKNN